MQTPTELREQFLAVNRNNPDFLSYLALGKNPLTDLDIKELQDWIDHRMAVDRAHFLWTFVQGYFGQQAIATQSSASTNRADSTTD